MFHRSPGRDMEVFLREYSSGTYRSLAALDADGRRLFLLRRTTILLVKDGCGGRLSHAFSVRCPGAFGIYTVVDDARSLEKRPARFAAKCSV